MLHLTAETDYAIRITSFLAQQQEITDAGIISEAAGITLRFTLKILRKLVMSDIAKSYKGVGGGYVLARQPGDITIYDVIRAIQGELSLAYCTYAGNGCSLHNEEHCAFRKLFDRLSAILISEMSVVTFDSLEAGVLYCTASERDAAYLETMPAAEPSAAGRFGSFDL